MDNQPILKRLQILDELSRELNVLSDQLDEALENDAEYQKVQEEVEKLKEEAKEKTARVKERVTEKASYKALQEDIKEKREEIKNHKEILSFELVEYYKETGSAEIEDNDGNMKKMKFSVKLVS